MPSDHHSAAALTPRHEHWHSQRNEHDHFGGERPAFNDRMTKRRRLAGFYSCWGIAFAMQFIAAIVLVTVGRDDHPEGRERWAAVGYWLAAAIIGFILGLVSTGFIVGYNRQVILIWKRIPRLIACVLWLGMAALSFALMSLLSNASYGRMTQVRYHPVSFIVVLVEYFALLFYALSYIPSAFKCGTPRREMSQV